MVSLSQELVIIIKMVSGETKIGVIVCHIWQKRGADLEPEPLHRRGWCLRRRRCFLVGKTLLDDWSPKILVGVIVFGVSLVALYSASAIYHFSNGSAKRILRLGKLDLMIYVIAGARPILPEISAAARKAWSCERDLGAVRCWAW